MNRTERANIELQLLARGLYGEYSTPHPGNSRRAYFNRSTVVEGLRKAGIDFEVVSADFAYFDSPRNSGDCPYEFVLKKLIDKVTLPEYVTLKRVDGHTFKKIPVRKFMGDDPGGFAGSDEVDEVRDKVLPELLDDKSRKFLQVEEALRRVRRKGDGDLKPYYNASILLYLKGDKRTPAEILEEYLREKGYPVEIKSGMPQWTDTFPACLECPALSVRISIAPNIFGSLSEKEKAANAKWGGIIGFPGYNYGGATVSSLCLQDDLSIQEQSKSLEKITCSIVPFFLTADREIIVDPVKARDILREISQYVQFKRK